MLPATSGGTDYQAYYDSETDLTWLADANANGAMSWTAANAWARDLTIGGVSDWRLPKTLQPDPSCAQQFGGQSLGTGCTGSEMGKLFYDVLGGTANRSIDAVHNDNYAKFTNIFSDFYWSGTSLAGADDYAWLFDFGYGAQDINTKSAALHAWAVHPGNVAGPSTPTVPEPQSLWLVALGLITALLWLRRSERLRDAAGSEGETI
ncbi:PEP-CTERM sorting domain-containing protein [Salinisphaera sp.]|uniref:PEP-CTERM sorting domain-containing protein n=1 Tax=Salinisphaera sp. TaxID=1914330 RepID=UPI002D77BDE2|nr:PEP-CTERM sorting domain-containing protein [Salinisphaera sp.]HET7315198.1 PEP-CTERM sorting domain-containing protein [Salinisphaera sp.]